MTALLAALLLDPLADFRRERLAAVGDTATADGLARDAAAAWTAGDRDTAARLARDARWRLPALPAGLPPHVRQTFGAGRLRHADRVNAVAYFPDGTAVASASRDGTVRVWNLLNGRERACYRGHAAADGPLKAAAVAVHPGGSLVASAGGLDIHLWDAATGQQRAVLSGGHAGPLRAVAFTTDGKLLVAADDRGRVVLWDHAAGSPRHTHPDQKKRLEGLAVAGPVLATVNQAGELAVFDLTHPANGPTAVTSPEEADKKALLAVAAAEGAVLVGGANGAVKVYAPTGSLQRTLTGHAGAVPAVALDASGKLAVSGGMDGTVRTWEAATGKPLRVFQGHPGPVTAVAVRPDGREIVSAGDDGRLRVWPLADTDIHRSVALAAPGFAAAVGPGGSAVVAGLDGKIKVFDPATGKVTKELTHAGGVAAMVAIGDRLATSGGDKLVKLWDVAAGTATDLAGHTSTVLALATSGDWLFSGSADRTVRMWQVPSGKPAWTWPAGSAVCALATLPDNRLAVGTADGSLTILDVAGGPKPLGDTVAHGRGTLALAATRDGLLASGGGDGTERLWRPSAAGPVPVGRIERSGSPNPVLGLAFAADGRHLAIAADPAVRVWDTQAGAELLTLRGHTAATTAVAFTADGGLVLSVGADATARAFPLPRADAQPTAHAGAVTAVALSADGKTLATGSADKTVKLWDAATGAERRTLTGPADAVGGLGFAADGRLVVASADGTVRWLAADGAELRKRPTHRTFAFGVAADGTAGVAWLHKEAAGFDLLPAAGDEFRRVAAGEVRCAAVAPDAKLAAAGGADGVVKLWNLATGERAGGDWKLGDAALVDVQLTADGKTLAAVDAAGAVTVATVEGQAGRMTASVAGAVGLAVGGDRLAVWTADGLVVAFDLGGKELRRWPLPGAVGAAVVAGKTLAVGNADGTAYLLELP